ncbi:MAG: hypothetical protein KME46_33600 [Brasilonema angustatum HA4187-MV1]|jgi:hypothetical protein|nr:hypothetical protein [Brasilonema angustatum HA4187-MV1]
MARKKSSDDLEQNNAQAKPVLTPDTEAVVPADNDFDDIQGEDLAKPEDKAISDRIEETIPFNPESETSRVNQTGVVDSESGSLQNIESPPAEPKPKKQRVTIPKKEITIILDGGRSRIKVLLIVDGHVTSNLVIDSVVCQTDAPSFGEQGSFSMSRGKDEEKKDLIEHWVVGSSAKLQGKPFIAMSDGDNHKINYFPILALGAIASLPNLHDLSTGSNEKSRSLSIKLITLSLANPLDLKAGIGSCKWIKVDGIKYSLSFSKTALNYPEGYGASLYAKDKGSTVYTLDVGFGTACVSQYNNQGKLPKRVSHKPNGGGGISTLIREFAESVASGDSSNLIKPSQLREILESSTFTDGKVTAIAPDGREIGSALESAIRNWIKDTPLTFALEGLSTVGRKNPIVLCGGGFEVPAVHQYVKDALMQSSIPETNLILPPNPGLIALSEMTKIYTQNNA